MNVEICAYTRTAVTTEPRLMCVFLAGPKCRRCRARTLNMHSYTVRHTRECMAMYHFWRSSLFGPVSGVPPSPFVCAYADAVVVMMHFYQTTCFFVVIVCNQKKIVFFRSASNVYLTHAHTHMHARTQIHTHAKWKR